MDSCIVLANFVFAGLGVVMSWRNPNWRYVNAADTQKPNYLRKKFEKIRKELGEQKRETELKVTPLKKVTK